MENKYVSWQKKKHTKKQRFLFLIPLFIIFVIVLPSILIILPYYFDMWLRLPKFILEPVNLIAGVLLIMFGFIYSIWTIKIQFEIGQGTPSPMMPTQKLNVTGPYSYCRNPMALGTIILYLGVVVLTGSLSSLGLLVIMTSALLIYIKLSEEKELEIRFGKKYIEYKKQVPFLIPNFRNKVKYKK